MNVAAWCLACGGHEHMVVSLARPPASLSLASQLLCGGLGLRQMGGYAHYVLLGIEALPTSLALRPP